ncbi:MarR family winged helix-turn-helix transcriptional regulator [Spirosoma arboris]|uniref:MarR family winged helix-turn-helix transcriptional regulator n=1 Tax=Spirosoma arboris TaxID=2682092 RepID=UPI0018DB48AD|nr:winged helix DNA-binding protein [Spirosoma arboris]
MNKTVALVNLWGEFEEKHPDASIEDFCRYQLIQQREAATATDKPMASGPLPMHPNGQLLRLIGRVNKLNMVYAYAALEGTGVNQLEEFGLLMHISQAKNPRKTEIIYSNLMELSSGTDMLNRLKSRGFIREYDDTEDRRSKRVELTEEGLAVIAICRQKISQLAGMMLHNMADDDIQLCIKLLKGVEQEFSARLPGDKGKKFDEIVREVM